MKNLILMMVVLVANISFANENNEFKACSIQDLRVLEMAHTRFGSLKEVIKEELLPREESCRVSKPRFAHPAVCGIRISQVDVYRFLVGRNGSSFEVTVDSSYISCHDMSALIIPEIREMKFIDPVIQPNM